MEKISNSEQPSKFVVAHGLRIVRLGSTPTDRRPLRDVRFHSDHYQIAELQKRTKRANSDQCAAKRKAALRAASS
jgi:hypothetical protein